ncbi:anti-sigma factor domain-containing protein [Ornithinimicrobium sp. LYQ103]|uniref:anti-sigma factor n=1 Tax=Ornithinimicrobium sp. LYQ103 TaxID=3378796 RepID=UPI003854E92E
MDEDDQVHDLAAAYAVDAVDETERARFEAHLSTCPDCTAVVQELREAAVELSTDLEVAPPADLRGRVLAAVAADAAAGRATEGTAHTVHTGGDVVPLRASRRPAHRDAGRPARPARWLAAAAAAAVVVVGGWGVTQVLGADPAERIVAASDAREYSARTDVGTVEVISSADRDAAVLRLPSDVDPPPEGSVYQAWFVGADGSARSAGVLTVEVLDEGDVVLEGTPEGAAAVGLTVEPAGGSQQPTTEPFAVVPLS